jgi:N-formylglutamate amidohydrolase
VALPYEQAEPAARRPAVCIGSDAFHTEPALAQAFVRAFTQVGWEVVLNEPFAGALVPASRYRRDARVQAVMVEVNRGLYMREDDGSRRADFERTAERVRGCCLSAVGAVPAIDALSRG